MFYVVHGFGWIVAHIKREQNILILSVTKVNECLSYVKLCVYGMSNY